MDKNEELQKWLNDERYVRAKDLKALWNMNQSAIGSFLKYRKIKPVKKIWTGQGGYSFYDKRKCINARAIYDAQLQDIQNCLNDTSLIQL